MYQSGRQMLCGYPGASDGSNTCHNLRGHLIGSLLRRIVCITKPQQAGLNASLLLHYVSELMRQQQPSGPRGRLILIGAKNNFSSHSVGERIHRLCGSGGPPVRVHTHATEVVPEARFHEGARRCIERLSWGTQHFINDGWHIAGVSSLEFRVPS